MYLIDESFSRHDGFINTGFFCTCKKFHAFAEPSLGFQIQGRVRNMYSWMYMQISIEKSPFFSFCKWSHVWFQKYLCTESKKRLVEKKIVCPPFYYNDSPVGWPRPKYSVKVLVTKSLKTYFVKLHGVKNCISYAHHYNPLLISNYSRSYINRGL